MAEKKDNKKVSAGSDAKKNKKQTVKPLKSVLPKDFPVKDIVKASVKCATILAALITVVVMFAVGADLSPSGILQGMSDKQLFLNASGDGYPVDVAGSEVIKTAHMTKGTAVLTDTSFTLYDKKGRSVLSEAHFLSSPGMENSGKYSLLFDRMGVNYMARNLSRVTCSGDAENPIICGDISSDGTFVLVTNSETTNALVYVYARDGKLIQSWKSVDDKISDVALSPSGRYIAWNGLSTKDGTLMSTVNVRKVGEKKNLKEYAFDDTLIVDLEFDTDARLFAVGDVLSAVLGVRKDNNFAYSYEDRNLRYYDINEDGELALVFSDSSDGSNASVIVLDRECREKAAVYTDLNSPCVDLSHGRINLLCDAEVSVYNFKGELVRKAGVPKDCQMIFSSEGGLLAKGMMWLAKVE